MEQIVKEKISADHLLYVSLKYTKTCDVILNLIYRWRSLIKHSAEKILKHAKKKKKILSIPTAPKLRIEKLKKLFRKEPVILQTLELYEFFKNIEKLKKTRSHEFRKGVNLQVIYKGEEVNINLDKLKEYAKIMDDFIDFSKNYLSK